MSAIATEESSTLTFALPVYRLKHKWTIKDFAATYLLKSTPKKDNDDDNVDQTNYPSLNSTWFSSSIDSQVEFRLNLLPRGRNKKSQDYLSLYLEMKRRRPSLLTKSADVNFKVSLLNEGNEKCHSREFRQKFVYPSACWGWDTFLKRSVLLVPGKALLPADTLTILAKIDVFPEPGITQGQAPLLAKLQVESIENVSDTLADLLDSGENSDVILEVEGKELPAHKIILAAHSPVFRAMFNGEMAEENEAKVAKVKIRNMKLAVAKKLIRFIYTGEIELDLDEYAIELFLAADKYEMSQLKALCSQSLCVQVTTGNAARLLTFANAHSLGQLKSTCFKYIRDHLEDVLLTGNWHFAQKLFTKELRQLKEKPGDKRKIPEESETVN